MSERKYDVCKNAYVSAIAAAAKEGDTGVHIRLPGLQSKDKMVTVHAMISIRMEDWEAIHNIFNKEPGYVKTERGRCGACGWSFDSEIHRDFCIPMMEKIRKQTGADF